VEVAANILNKQPQKPGKGWFSNLGIGRGANTIKSLDRKCHKDPRTWTDSLDKRPGVKKADMRFGTWNVRSLYRAGSFKTKWILER
jgi:hypothetical protein